MLQIFRDHHAHCVTKSDFCQQIVKRCQLHAIQLALNIFLRDFIQLTATTQSMVEQTTAQAYRIITLEVFQQLTNFGARFRANDKVQPSGIRASARSGNDFNGLTAGKRLRQRVRLAVNACAHAGMTDIGMHCISEVDGRCTGRQLDNAPFRCENVNLIREEIGFNALDKFKRATGTLLQLQQALHPALGAYLRGSAGFAVLFISPVRGNTHLRHLIHIFGTDLDLNRHAVRANHRGVQRLIAVRFWNGDIVFHAARTRLVQAVHLAQHAITGVRIIDDHAESVDVHDRVKTLLFEHHFAVNRIKMLLATTDAARYSRFLQTPFDFRKNLLDHLFTVAARGFHHFFDYAITVGIQRLKTQLFEFGFNVVDT